MPFRVLDQKQGDAAKVIHSCGNPCMDLFAVVLEKTPMQVALHRTYPYQKLPFQIQTKSNIASIAFRYSFAIFLIQKKT